MNCCEKICPDSCLVNKVSPSDNDGVLKRIKHGFLCPPHGILERIITNFILLGLSLSVPWAILGVACLPGTNIFSLIVVIDACIIAGLLVSKIKIPTLPPLPPLLGMLLAGFCLRNIPIVNVAEDIDPEWSSVLRSIALALILIKAGLELDASALKKVKNVCLRLTALPCLVECITCAVACRFLLGFPWEWGFMLGFVLGAVSPAVIVPSLLSLQEKCYGVEQGIPTLVIAASSFDDVLAISGFSVVLGIAFSQNSVFEQSEVTSVNGTENTTYFAQSTLAESSQTAGELIWTIFRGPVEMLGGILFGIINGIFLWFIPGSKTSHTTRDRFLLVVGIGIFLLFATRRFGFPGAGALAAIVLAFVAALSWKKEKERVSEYVGYLWSVFEPVMFGLIGAEISLEKLDSGTLGLGVCVLFIGLIARTLATFLAVSCAGFTAKEKLFVCFAWLPKATVQAAIGSVALDTARSVGASENTTNMANQVLTIAVLSIIITAPIGATAIGLSGPKLLQKSSSKDNTENDLTPAKVDDRDEEMIPMNELNEE